MRYQVSEMVEILRYKLLQIAQFQFRRNTPWTQHEKQIKKTRVLSRFSTTKKKILLTYPKTFWMQ